MTLEHKSAKIINHLVKIRITTIKLIYFEETNELNTFVAIKKIS